MLPCRDIIPYSCGLLLKLAKDHSNRRTPHSKPLECRIPRTVQPNCYAEPTLLRQHITVNPKIIPVIYPPVGLSLPNSKLYYSKSNGTVEAAVKSMKRIIIRIVAINKEKLCKSLLHNSYHSIDISLSMVVALPHL